MFLTNFTKQIFTIGKTAAFLGHLGQTPPTEYSDLVGLSSAITETAQLLSTTTLPFSATLETVLERHLTILLSSSTLTLKSVLDSSCGLSALLTAFDYLYLAADSVILSTFETRQFSAIDRCSETWNDRFLLTDMLAEAYASIPAINPDSLTVHSSYTSSRTMESRRRSVKILSALSVTYHVPWPIANIIPPSSMTAYQRIALLLSQLRRAKHSLEQRAYFAVKHTTNSFNSSDQKTAQTLFSTLHLFVNTLYSHLTTCIIQPLTQSMRSQLSGTGTIDEMIACHKTYIDSLEHACLASGRIKPLQDAVISVLDLCIRFADLVTSSSTLAGLGGGRRKRKGSGSEDFEASSFISARSQRRRRRAATEDDSDSEDDDDEEEDFGGHGKGGRDGYSTFMLDEDTSLGQAILKLREAFQRHLSFLNAGLRGVARSSRGEVGEGFEMLADLLAGCVHGGGRGDRNRYWIGME